MHFSCDENENRPPWRSSPSQGPRACPIWPWFLQIMPWSEPNPSSFDLKAIQPRTWCVISVKGLSGKLPYPRFNFFPQLGHIKWCHTKVLWFFDFFFEIVMPNLGPAWNDGVRKLPLAARRCGVPPKWSKFREENDALWIQKWFFLKKIKTLSCMPLKCKPTPVPAESAEACIKFKIYLRRLPQRNDSWYVCPRWSIIYVACCYQW
jgi:hypothetical protein